MTPKLNEIQVPLSKLVLDPNNPRFVQTTTPAPPVNDTDAVTPEVQDALLKRFSAGATVGTEDTDEPDTISVQDLRSSMLEIGYVGIDKIVVRKVTKSTLYLVIEGNRRVAALKSLERDYNTGSPPFEKDKARTQYEKHKATYENLTVVELETANLSPAQIQKAVSVILGIRHHGSVLEWDPLPRAFNIFSEYKKSAGYDVDEITLGLTKEVASRLCISAGEVKQALRAYIAYMQLKEASENEVRNEDYSLIETAVTNRHLCTGYLKVDQNTFKLDTASLERLIRICQFGRRDKLPVPSGPKKIIPDPRVMRRLGQILHKKLSAPSDREREFIDNILARIEDEMDPLTVDDGLDDVTAHLASIQWRQAIEELLNQQKDPKNNLDVEFYQGADNERGYREEAQRIVDRLALIMQI